MPAERMSSVLALQYDITTDVIEKDCGLCKYIATFKSKKTGQERRKFLYSMDGLGVAIDEMAKQIKIEDLFEESLNSF